ncbi:MAG TPA: AI-2E family transporter [Solirubrobacteraceae bacterium]|nr:AI-2E family transporter [Solirubrobacteraceae bacterium]
MAPVVIRRWVQLVLLPLALLALWALARAIGALFLVLVIASLVALVLSPLVRFGSRFLPRGLAILFAYLTVVVIVALIAIGLAAPVATQLIHFEHNLPALTRQANRELADIQRFFDRHGIKIHIEKQGQSALSTLEKDLLKRSGDIVSFSQGLLSKAVSVGIDLILILVLSIYLLVYGPEIGRLVRRLMPAGDGTPADDYPRLVQSAVGSYVRGQLLFSLVMGGSAALLVTIFGLVGLFPAGTSYSWFFGVFYGLMEFIPYIGPIIGPIPALLVALFEHPISAVWLLMAFVGLQQLEGHVIAPQLFRYSLRINPILIIIALLVGDKLYGIAGALVALPVIAVLRVTIIYLHRHTVLEAWGNSLLDEPPSPPPEPEPADP